MTNINFPNPYRPGAGHMPPYLAGREFESNEFKRLLKQSIVLENLILTGLRGVGKTVLLETLKPMAIQAGWLWVGTDLSEAASLSETHVATRLLADISVVTSPIIIGVKETQSIGFAPKGVKEINLGFDALTAIFQNTPGLTSDKLKAVLEFAWFHLAKNGAKGIIFAYDEAQNFDDHSAKDEYPLSLVLDVFQSIQRKNLPLMLALAGLPTLFPKLVEARTFSERMFHILTLDRLNERDSRDAILQPIKKAKCPVTVSDPAIEAIVAASGGYPYFIQFICREVFDSYLQSGGKQPIITEITRKLDADFFVGRWSKATDRQRELMLVVANLETSDKEFTVQEVAEKAAEMLDKPFSPSQINQMFNTLSAAGLIYKNRHGKYSFAVPLLGEFILRQLPNGV